MTTVHLVQHTHWDREWYFTAEDARVLSSEVFSDAIDELLENEHVNFCLDGQTSIVDEYLELCPERRDDVVRLVGEGRLFVGPWYTQSDCLLVDGESILRNLTIGIRDARTRYGAPMMIGYLPDTFGFNAQLPTLLRQVGIDSFIAWRGCDFDGYPLHFRWGGLGEEWVYAVPIPFGYMAARMDLEDIERPDKFARERLGPLLEKLRGISDETLALMPAGYDQKSMVLAFDEVVRELDEASQSTCVLSSYPQFLGELRKRGEELPKHRGELRMPRFSRVHRTIGSVRTRLKQANFEMEQRLLRVIEPLSVIAQSQGIEIPAGLVEKAWKLLLENQAHDSMGGCVSDSVAHDIEARLKRVREITDGIENLVGRRVAEGIAAGPREIIVFNTDPRPFSGRKRVRLLSRAKRVAINGMRRLHLEKETFFPARMAYSGDRANVREPGYWELEVSGDLDLPGLGYRTFEIVEAEEELRLAEERPGTEISGAGMALALSRGEMVLRLKDGTEIRDFLRLVDSGNDGDTYDYSPVDGESEVPLPYESSFVRGDALVVRGRADLPVDLESRVGNGDHGDMPYEIELRFEEDGFPRIEGRVRIENTVLSHRVRLRVNVGEGEGGSIAQIPAGFVENRPSEALGGWEGVYAEKPVPIFNFEKSVSVKRQGGYMTLFADGIKEYEYEAPSLLLTIFATTGQLGKPDLAWRPGRASGNTSKPGHVMFPTPDAEELGDHEVRFALAFGAGPFDGAKVADWAERRLSPSVTYQRQSLNLFVNRLDDKVFPKQHLREMPRELSVLEIPEGLVVSTLCKSETEEGHLVLRVSNPTDRPVRLPEGLRGLKRVNALEEPVGPAEEVGAFSYATMLVPFGESGAIR